MTVNLNKIKQRFSPINLLNRIFQNFEDITLNKYYWNNYVDQMSFFYRTFSFNRNEEKKF